MHTPNLSAVVGRRLLGLGLSLGMALAALLLLGRAVGGAAAAGSPSAGNPAAPHQPAVTFGVTATADSDDNNLNDGQCHDQLNGGCSLRAAVQQLNHDSGGSITLPPGTFNLTNNGDGDLQLQKNISLTGAGPAATLVQGNPSGWTHRILRVAAGANVIVSGVTISGGYIITGSGNGGGIDVITSTLLLTNSVVAHNVALRGGGLYNTGQVDIENSRIELNESVFGGAGIYTDANDSDRPGGTLTVRHSQVLTNSALVDSPASSAGGGIYYNDTTPALGFLKLEFSTLSGNQSTGASGLGGGLYQAHGSATLSSTTVGGNQGTDGAGIYVDGGRLVLAAGSIIETNVTGGYGGGVHILAGTLQLNGVNFRHNQAQRGGGLVSDDSRLDVVNSVFISNTATDSGGGWYSQRDTGVLTNTVFSDNLAVTIGGFGGGLWEDSSALTFTLGVFVGNTAKYGGGLVAAGGDPLTRTVLISTTFSGNHAVSYGGGLYNNNQSLVVLIGSDVTSNTSNADGGGAYNEGRLLLTNSSVRYNTAGTANTFGSGGGVANEFSGALSLTGTTLSNNTAIRAPAGGLLNNGAGATATLVNSTVSGNRTTSSASLANANGPADPARPAGGHNIGGAGVANLGGAVDLSNVTVAGNVISQGGDYVGYGAGLLSGGGLPTTTTLRNTLVALNLDLGGPSTDCTGSFNAQGYNLVQNTTNCTLTGNSTGDVTGHDPLLQPLANYGGSTETRGLLAGSPAIDAGNPAGCRDSLGHLITTDQRGQLRPLGAHCDIGAVEGLALLNRYLFLALIER